MPFPWFWPTLFQKLIPLAAINFVRTMVPGFFTSRPKGKVEESELTTNGTQSKSKDVDIQRYARKPGAAKRTIEDQDRELRRAERDVQTLEEKLRKEEEERQRLGQELNRVREVLSSEKKKRENAERALDEGARKLQEQGTEVDQLRRVLGNAESKIQHERDQIQTLQTLLHQTKSLSETRAKELRDAHAILTVGDEPSDSDVLRIFSRLNQTMYQCSAQLVENWSFTSEITQARRDAYEYSKQAIGGVADALLHARSEEQEIATQIAVQATFACWAQWALFAWSLPRNEIGGALTTLHNVIRKNEPQITGGKWRSLTMHHLEALPKVRDPVPELYASLLEYISNVLVTSGVNCKDVNDIVKDVDGRRGNDIKEIIRLTLAARETIGVKIVSKDFEPFIGGYGGVYKPEEMEGAYKDERGAKERKAGSSTGIVFCATEVGLRKWEKGGGESKFKMTVPLKSKVVLEDDIREIMGLGAFGGRERAA